MDNLAKIAKLRESVERAQHELRYTEDHQKMIARKISDLTRRERTNRLCTRAGMLESFLPHPEALSNDQVMDLLKTAFRQPPVRQLLAQILEKADYPNP